MKGRCIIKKEFFDRQDKTVKIKQIGDEFDPMWGWDVITLSLDDIIALLAGMILESDTGGEYGLLIGLKNDELRKETIDNEK